MKKLSEKTLTITSKDSGYNKQVSVKKYRLPNGIVESFFVDKDKDSVQIFAITKDNTVICVKQFRPGSEKIEEECPGGGLEKSENKLEAAARELEEETGFAGNIEHIGSMKYSPYSSGTRHCFMATNCEKVSKKLNLDPNEFLEVVLYSLEEFKEKLNKFEIRGADLAWTCLAKLGL